MNVLEYLQLYLLLSCLAVAFHPLQGAAQQTLGTSRASQEPARDGQHDFDWDIGAWKTHQRRLLHPQPHQWNIYFTNSASGILSPPAIGEFKNGRGEFYDQEPYNGRAIMVRFVISDITPNSCRFEQAFSDDGGKTWEVNWIATDTRIEDEST